MTALPARICPSCDTSKTADQFRRFFGSAPCKQCSNGRDVAANRIRRASNPKPKRAPVCRDCHQIDPPGGLTKRRRCQACSIACKAASKAAARDRNRDADNAKRKADRAADPEAARLRDRAIRESWITPEWRATKNAKTIAWFKADPRRARAIRGVRARRMRDATPAWADLDAIAAFYADTPEGYHVDHIVPLKGFTPEGWRVSGLHVAHNLQYLTAAENLAKHNRMRPHEAVIGPAFADSFALAA